MIITRYRLIKKTVLLASCLWGLLTVDVFADNIGTWQKIDYSLSGLAKMNPARSGFIYIFLGIIDNKHDNEIRTVRVDLDSNYKASVTVLPWKNSYPSGLNDLESVAAIPNGKTGTQQQFVASNSSGKFWRFTVNSSNQIDNVIAGSPDLAQKGLTSSAEEIESVAFFINSNSGKIKLVWAGRGSRDHSAYLFAAYLTNGSNSISYDDDNNFKLDESHFNWPRPTWGGDGDTRLISDVKVSNDNKIFVSSAFDGGDYGPFAGVLYNPGTFQSASSITFGLSPYAPKTALFIGDKGKKVEALELLTGDADDGFIVGTDNEKEQDYIMVLK